MPVYELFCLARPALAHAARSDLLQAAAAAVTGAGGFLIDYKNYGERRLAYPVRAAGTGDKYGEVRGGVVCVCVCVWGELCAEGRTVFAAAAAGRCEQRRLIHPTPSLPPSPFSLSHPQAFIWQMAFSTPATALPALERTLALDDRVLRSVVLKRRAPVGPAPTPAAVARRARAALAGQAVGAALAGHRGPAGGQGQQQ
jgi:ribosomal protein S6